MGVQSASGIASMRLRKLACRGAGVPGCWRAGVLAAGVLADGDGEEDLRLSEDDDHGVGIEAAVGPHRELPPDPGMAYPSHRLPQEVGGAASGVGAALTQPGHQHLTSASGHGQQGVIAPGTGVAMVAGPLLGQPVGLADGRVQVDGQRSIAGSRPCRPGPGQQLAAHLVQLADMAPKEAAQEGTQGGWALDYAADGAGRPDGAQHVGVVDAVSPSQSLPPRKRGAEATSVIILSPGLARPGARPRSRCCSTSWDRPIAGVAAFLNGRTRTVAWANRARIVQGRVNTERGGTDGRGSEVRRH